MLPFAAGSVSDVTLRILADKLGAAARHVGDDRKPAARRRHHGRAGRQDAPPDGYTLVTFSSSTAISVSLLKACPTIRLTISCRSPASAPSPTSSRSTPTRTYRTLPRSARGRPREAGRAQHRHHHGRLDQSSRRESVEIDDRAQLHHRAVPHARRSADRRAAQRRRRHHPVLRRAEIGDRRQADPGARQHHPETRDAYAPEVPTVDEAGVKGFDGRDLERHLRPGRHPARGGRRRSTGRSARPWPIPNCKDATPSSGLSRCRPRRTSFPARLQAEIGKWAGSSRAPASSSSEFDRRTRLPLWPDKPANIALSAGCSMSRRP